MLVYWTARTVSIAWDEHKRPTCFRIYIRLSTFEHDQSGKEKSELKNGWTCISPTTSISGNRVHCEALFLHMLQDGFIIKPSDMDTHLSHVLCIVIGKLRTSSHQLEIKKGRYAHKPMDNRICQLCHWGVESKEHYACHCSIFYKIRG